MFKRTVATAAPAATNESDMARAAEAHGDYVTAVTQLVDDQSEVLFRMVSAAAEQASTAIQHIYVTREARSVTASVGAHAAIFHIEAITDRPQDMGRARTYMTGQARCIVPTPDGTTVEWVLALQRPAANDTAWRRGHTWMDARATQPITEAAVERALRSVFL
jgi:hypothetical protein